MVKNVQIKDQKIKEKCKRFNYNINKIYYNKNGFIYHFIK